MNCSNYNVWYIVEAHQGRMILESAVGKGSILWMRLPLKQATEKIRNADLSPIIVRRRLA